MPTTKKGPLQFENQDSTSDQEFLATSEATEWRISTQGAQPEGNPFHQEDFAALVATAVKGKKAGA